MVFRIDELNSMHIDVLKEIGNVGAGNAVTALAKMLNKRIEMNVPEVKILEFREVSDILGGAEIPVIGVLLNVSGDLTGSIMFIFEINAAREIVSLLIGSQNCETEEFSELEISAIKEVGNILAGSYLSALFELTGLKTVSSVPYIAIDMAGAILSVPAIEFGKSGDKVLYIATEFSDGDTKVKGDFFLVLDVDSFETLLKVLGVVN